MNEDRMIEETDQEADQQDAGRLIDWYAHLE